ncbi:MAG: hypothetical protein ACFB0Z_01880 [Candidatus Phaeomarinobacter sp.]
MMCRECRHWANAVDIKHDEYTIFVGTCSHPYHTSCPGSKPVVVVPEWDGCELAEARKEAPRK